MLSQKLVTTVKIGLGQRSINKLHKFHDSETFLTLLTTATVGSAVLGAVACGVDILETKNPALSSFGRISKRLLPNCPKPVQVAASSVLGTFFCGMAGYMTMYTFPIWIPAVGISYTIHAINKKLVYSFV